jgi:hypothetical protein
MARRRTFIGPQLRGVGGVGRQYDVWPLDRFGIWKQFEVACAVSEPSPPDKWLRGDLWQMPSRAWHEWHWQRGIDPAKQRPKIPARIREAVYRRDGYTCLHCGGTDKLSLDHILPYSHGGADTVENLQTLCTPCNSRKGARV